MRIKAEREAEAARRKADAELEALCRRIDAANYARREIDSAYELGFLTAPNYSPFADLLKFGPMRDKGDDVFVAFAAGCFEVRRQLRIWDDRRTHGRRAPGCARGHIQRQRRIWRAARSA
jgi:hypothetical protein